MDTPKRTIVIEDSLWAAVKAAAKKRGESAGAIVRTALRQYLGK